MKYLSRSRAVARLGRWALAAVAVAALAACGGGGVDEPGPRVAPLGADARTVAAGAGSGAAGPAEASTLVTAALEVNGTTTR